VRREIAHAGRRLEEHLREDRDELVADERVSSGEALEERRAEREHVGLRPEIAIAAGLLGRDVPGRPEQGAGLRELGRGVRAPREPEVDEHRALERAVREHDVRGLHVAVDELARVRRPERGRDARADDQRLAHREGTALEALGERLALDPLHRQERLA
jgi:hypothetical protein